MIEQRGEFVALAVQPGAANLAACGETQIVEVEKVVTREVEVIKEVPVETVVEKVVTVEVPAPSGRPRPARWGRSR